MSETELSEAVYYVCIKGDAKAEVFPFQTKEEVLKAADDACENKQAIEVFMSRKEAAEFFEVDESKNLRQEIRRKASIAKQARRIEARLALHPEVSNARQIVQGIKRGRVLGDQAAKVVNIPPAMQNY